MINRKNMFLRHLFNLPVTLIMAAPLVIVDIFGTIYQQLGFRLCKIPLIKRSNYIKIDRHKLKYLSLVDKMWCMYCGYANGVMHYGTELTARTEQYWCAIKHKKSKNFIEPPHHKNFAEYGDEKAYKK